MMDKFVEYDIDRGWWFDLFLQIGVLVSKYPELSAKRGDLFEEYIASNYARIAKEYGEEIGQDDTVQT